MSIRHDRPRIRKRGRNRKTRPKTFGSEESAKKWAEAQGLKNYSLENLKSESVSTKKIRIIVG